MLIDSTENWVNVPTNSMLTIHGQTVMVNPIIDAFSDRDPCHRRSSAFAQTKGLTTNEKATLRVNSPVSTPGPGAETQRRIISPMILPSLGRSRTPDPPKARLVLSETTPSDIRSAVDPPAQRLELASKLPSQGNIKKKRRSLNAGEIPHPAEFTEAEIETPPSPPSPVQNTSRGGDYMTAEKAARVLGMAL